MVVGILTRLAAFSIKKPKTVVTIAAVVLLGALGAHYKIILGKNAELKRERLAYQAAISAFEDREATLQQAINNERLAAAEVAADRDAARRALDTFRRGREADPESIEWASQQIPVGELERLCAALPTMEGCS